MFIRVPRHHFGMFGFFSAVAVIVINTAVGAALLWAALSIVTSIVKVGAGDCGSQYGIDRFAHGNLFCVVE